MRTIKPKGLITILNYTTLKPVQPFFCVGRCLITILNYTTLKLYCRRYDLLRGLITILNYTTLKHRTNPLQPPGKFDYHLKLHYSQTHRL